MASCGPPESITRSCDREERAVQPKESAWQEAVDAISSPANDHVVLEVPQGAGERLVEDSRLQRESDSAKHFGNVHGGSTHLRSKLVIAIAAFAALAAVILSAAVAAVVATSLNAGEGTSAVLPTSTSADASVFDASIASIAKRRLDSGATLSIGNLTFPAEEAGQAKPLCLDAVKGELCHRLVVWAMEDGLRLYPENFQGLTRASPFHSFQQAMHERNPEFCPPPCLGTEESSADSAALMPMVSVSGSYGSCDYGHSDTSPAHAGCFIVRNGKLLTEKLTYDGLRYDIPGGQSDWSEPARCTAHREALEETGYLVAPRELLAVVRNGFHIYRCELLRSSPIRGHDHEISWVGWMSPDEIRAKVSQGKFRFPEAARYADWVR